MIEINNGCEHIVDIYNLFLWYKIDGEDTWVKPNICNYRVNFCPVCGANIRNVTIKNKSHEFT